MRGAVLACRTAGAPGRPLRCSAAPRWGNRGIAFPTGGTPWVVLSFFTCSLAPAVGYSTDCTWFLICCETKANTELKDFFPCVKHTSFSCLSHLLTWQCPLLGFPAPLLQRTSLRNQINLPALSSPSQSSGPPATEHRTSEHLLILLAPSLVKYLSFQTCKRLVHLKGEGFFSCHGLAS